jgi:hypothetical protein
MSRTLLALLACFALLSTGCFTTSLRDARMTPGEKHDEWRPFFFWGLAGHAEIDVKEFCPGDVYEVAMGTNGGTWFVSAITLGIYSPEKIFVTCSGGPAEVQAAQAAQAVQP